MVMQPQAFDAYDDRDLVAAFQAGDADAFAQIVGVHHRSLTAEAQRRLRSPGDAEDAVQETLLRAYLALDRFGGEYRLHAWLSRILANVCADTGARRAAEVRLVDRLGPERDEAPPADVGIGDAELRQTVREAVDSLPDSYRVAFVLREIEERTYAEVAEELGISETNARARVHRARTSLTRSLRNTGAVLAGIPIPLHLLGLKRLVLHAATERVRGLAHYSGKSRIVPPGPDVPSSVIPAASQPPLPLLFQGPLAETSQAVALAASSPLSQTIIAGASVAWHATLPVAAALATVAASAAMVGSGAAANGPATPAPAPNSHVILAASTANLASYVGAPPIGDNGSAPTGVSGTSVSPGSSSSASSAGPSKTAGAVAATTATDPWSWVSNAASGVAGGVASTSVSTSPSSGSQVPTQAASSSASAGATAPVGCPFTGYFPGVPSGPIPLPPPEPAGTVAGSYFASDTFTLGTTGPAFEVAGLGQFEQGANTVTLHTLYGACLPGTTNPELVGNLSNPADEALGQLQLRGALVSSQTDQGETTAYYRGTSVWLDGPNAASDPLVFVAQVTLAEPANISTLRVAFFGPTPNFTGTPATCTAAAGTSSTPVNGTPGPATSTTDAPTTGASTSAAPGSGSGTSAGPDTSSGSNSTSGASPTGSSNCPPSPGDPASGSGSQTSPTSSSATSSPSATATSPSSGPGGSVTGSASSESPASGITAGTGPNAPASTPADDPTRSGPSTTASPPAP
jgi:RNA polymerase sigma factor (sigma-70 family)